MLKFEQDRWWQLAAAATSFKLGPAFDREVESLDSSRTEDDERRV